MISRDWEKRLPRESINCLNEPSKIDERSRFIYGGNVYSVVSDSI